MHEGDARAAGPRAPRAGLGRDEVRVIRMPLDERGDERARGNHPGTIAPREIQRRLGEGGTVPLPFGGPRHLRVHHLEHVAAAVVGEDRGARVGAELEAPTSWIMRDGGGVGHRIGARGESVGAPL